LILSSVVRVEPPPFQLSFELALYLPFTSRGSPILSSDFDRIAPTLRKSITFDNDTAFAHHGLLRTMRAMTTWFCDAYASWQKGGVENANGRLRRWLPRHDIVLDEEIQDIALTANLTPKKCLGFKSPFPAILKELGKDVQIRFS
jgi:transposase, IS30 family